jgi:SAM-dependent methyltransferase
MSLDDPDAVAREYANEARLAARASIYRNATGPAPLDVAFTAVLERRPRTALEVGAGRGEFAERLAREIGVEVVAVDLSPRMVDLVRARGVDARVADARSLPFPAGAFDAVVANFVLFHVPDPDAAVAEAARVLRERGRFVATTNGRDHLQELFDLAGLGRVATSFDAEDGASILRRRFARVEERDGSGHVVFPDRDAAQAYLDACPLGEGRRLPPFSGPLRARRRTRVFVADDPLR